MQTNRVRKVALGRVFIAGGGHQYEEMFRMYGWEVTTNLEHADLIQFTGGADVSPNMYGESHHPQSATSAQRDMHETALFQSTLAKGIPMAGICRGGQFLNVMNGGRMYQHVDGHAIGGTHSMIDEQTGYRCDVTSTHHQMMIPHEDGRILARPPETRCTRKEYVDNDGELFIVTPDEERYEIDVEVVYYPQTNVLCFQPHPEFIQGEKCRPYYFAQIEGRLLKNWGLMEELIECRIYDGGNGYIEPDGEGDWEE